MEHVEKTPDSTPRGRGRPRGWHDNSAQNTIKSLDRAMQVLERLSEFGGVTLSELAGDLGQAPASIYRVLTTLEARGMVEFDPLAQRWYVGSNAFRIGARFLRRTGLVERARPVLRDLMERSGETANLGIAREGSVLFLSQVETHASIRAFFPPGTISPMHASGIGKALLAHMEPERRARVLPDRLEQFTEHTLTDRAALAEEMERIRASGYAIDAEERNLGMRCIAAPIFDLHREVVGGISVSGPAQRLTQAMTPALAAQVVASAQTLSRAIGWPD